jgi:hypothetical protein
MERTRKIVVVVVVVVVVNNHGLLLVLNYEPYKFDFGNFLGAMGFEVINISSTVS